MPDDDLTKFSPPPGMTPADYRRTTGGNVRWQPPSAAHLQELLPQYEILSLLGHGGMGAVYKARQKTLDRPVAIKILPIEAADDGDANFVERFKNEARTMARMNHPGIVHVYDYGETAEGQLYFVMEFVDGTDVQKMISGSGKLPPEHALGIAAHVCDALSYAHAHGVVHRDIKPANVIINKEGEVKVADFGLAKAAEAGMTSGLTKTGVSMGTPDYVAPEALAIGLVADHRADLYAVGVMLYHMLTGEVPRGKFKMPSQKVGSDVRLDAIIDHAMESDRDERYQNAIEIRRDLDDILTTARPMVENESVPVGVEAASQIQAPAKKPRARMILSIIGAASVIAIGAFFAFQKRDQRGPLSPLSGTSAAGATESAQEPVRPASAAVTQPAPEAATASPSAMPKWRPITFTEQELRGMWATLGPEGELNVTGDFHLPGTRARNLAIRAEMRKKDNTNFALLVRMQDGFHRQFDYFTSAAWMQIKRQNLKDLGTLARIDFPSKPILPNEWVPIEFAVIGEAAFGRIRGVPFPKAASPEVLGAGAVSFVGIGSVRNLEFLPLDEAPESEALKLFAGNSSLQAVSLSAIPTASTKDKPFVNTLGMKFVPVPITGGPTDKQRVLFSIWETRVQDYALFVTETKREWPQPPFTQDTTHPVVNLCWDDAQAFCKWLTGREQKAGKISPTERYRLPLDHEWSCAVGIGHLEDPARSAEQKGCKIADEYPWGTTWPPPQGAGNYADETARTQHIKGNDDYLTNYDDGFGRTSPVGSFVPNGFGLFDLGGNAHEMVEDFYRSGSPNHTGRGGSFNIAARNLLLSSNRSNDAPDKRIHDRGFRCVLASSPQ